MRLVNLDTLKSGARINMALKKINGQTLLPAGALLTDRYIQRLKNFGFTAIYIDDDLFNSVEAVPALTDETKAYALNVVQNALECCQKGKLLDVNAVKESGKLIYEEIRSVSDQPISLFNMFIVDDLRCLHSVNVASMVAALTIAKELKTSVAQDIVVGALLHDLMVDNIAEKENNEHPLEAMEYLKRHRELSIISYMSVAMHHENFNGTGYPKRLERDAIYEGARIIRICDAYDNITSGLANYKRQPEYHAVEYINGHVGSMFDPEYVALFNQTIAIYPTGATVVLDNGRAAIVTKQNTGMPTRPVVRLLMKNWEECLEFDLMTNNTIFIQKVEL